MEEYKYNFDKDKCWYKEVCSNFNTNSCNSSCIRYSEIYFLFSTSNLPTNKWYPINLDLSEDSIDYDVYCKLADIKDNICPFVKKGNNLYIYSKICGNGKSTWSIKLLQAYFNSIWVGNGYRERAIFISVPELLRKVKTRFDSDNDLEELENRLYNDDLVIWDDVASTKLSSSDYTHLLSYIDSRILSGKSNIYTGNFNKDELELNLGTRLASRIFNNSITIEFKEEDRRGQRYGRNDRTSNNK